MIEAFIAFSSVSRVPSESQRLGMQHRHAMRVQVQLYVQTRHQNGNRKEQRQAGAQHHLKTPPRSGRVGSDHERPPLALIPHNQTLWARP